MSVGKLIVLTAPLTEACDNAGFFIQMALASIPGWMEWAISQKYPDWREVPLLEDGSAAAAPAGLRVLEAIMAAEFGRDEVVVCYPDQLDRFIGPSTRVVGISTHNPLGTTFAAGVYASIFGTSREPVNALYARRMFEKIRSHPNRNGFKVILGGSGAWQIDETGTQESFGIDCIVHGRAEAPETVDLFRQAICAGDLPRQLTTAQPSEPGEIVVPESRSSFGVIEMTTGCGRRCSFCLPDLNPRISVPKAEILKAVAANVDAGNGQISLATEDMFVWQTDERGLPFYVPNSPALIDLYRSIAEYPGVQYVTLSHCTMAPVLVDSELIAELSDILLARSPIRLSISTHPDKRAISPLIGIETGSVRLARRIMAGKSLPFDVEYWPHVVLEGLRILNQNNWVPVCTLMVGTPEETDEDARATLDLLYEVERRGLSCIWVPSIFTPLRDTRLEKGEGVRETHQLSRLQWQIIMKGWRNSAQTALQTRWGKAVFGAGSLVLWATRLRRVNGPSFTWPLVQFSRTLPESWLHKTGRLYEGRPLPHVTREDLLKTLRPESLEIMRRARQPEALEAGPRRPRFSAGRPRRQFARESSAS